MRLDAGRLMSLPVISLAFLLLVIALEALLVGYWLLAIEPRLQLEAEANSTLIAQSQAAILSTSLEASGGETNKAQVLRAVDTLLLAHDPVMQVPYFRKIQLEVDYDALHSRFDSGQRSLDVTQSTGPCTTCFVVPIELYSSDSDEIIGIATFSISDSFFQSLKRDVKQTMVFQGITIFGLLFVAWVGVVSFAKSLNKHIYARQQAQQLLQQAKDEAEKANRTKSDFLANMSHEIRTPMNAITGLCYLVLKTRLSSHQRSHLEKIHSSANLLLRIINDILDFSKIEAGKLVLESAIFKLDDVLDNLAHIVMAEAGNKGLDILYKVDSDVPQQLEGDPLRLGQILLNLVSNSIKFTHQGEVSISVRNLEQSEHSILLEFSVRDSGIGIDQRRITDLFSPFTQADNSTSRKFGGSGLGLAICANLVKVMQGDIRCQSVLGAGTLVTFTARFIPQLAKHSYLLPQNLKELPVLVVDDSHSAREVFAEMLSRFEFNVAIAESGEQAIELMCESKPANHYRLVLMDWKMPGLNGVQAAKIIKNSLTQASKPIIILTTAYGFDETAEEDASYLDGILVKPVSQSALYNCILDQFANNVQRPVGRREHRQTEQAFQKYQGIRVLLAEDNKINQEVALSLLREAELEVDVANNGIEVIDLFTRKNYALILMDVQMPGMDGYQTTRKIRESEQGLDKRTPIIAMTAHAMQGDRDKCMAAGMDDYLTKPVDVGQFHQQLKRWLLPTMQTSESQLRSPVPDQKPSEWVEDLQGIDSSAALSRLNHNEALFHRLLRNFETDNRDIINHLEKLVSENDLNKLKMRIHQLKGEAGNLGAKVVYQAAIDIELLLAEGNLPADKEFLNALEQALLPVFNAIRKLYVHSDDAGIPEKACTQGHDTSDLELATKQLAELKTMLTNNNLEACDLGVKLARSFPFPDGNDALDKLMVCLEKLDFSGATTQVLELSAILNNINHQ